MLLENVLKEYLYECNLRKMSERTVKGLRNNNKRLFVFLRSEFKITELEEVKRIHIQAYVEYLSDLGRKETYVNTLLKSYRGFFRYCEDEEYIKENPMKKIKFQREEMPVIQTFNQNEVRNMIGYYSGRKFLDVRNKLIVVILFDSGIRNHELCDILLEDITDNSIKIHGKGKKIRYVPITPMINKMLIRYLRVRDVYICDKLNYQKEYLFLSQKGKKLTVETIERIIRTCGEETGVRKEIRCSPHTCRHYYAQAQLKNGCDLFTVSRLLGHNNINITKRYLSSLQTEDSLEMAIKTTPLSNL